MKLQHNHTYINRIGQQITVVNRDPKSNGYSLYPFESTDDGDIFTDEGHYFHSKKRSSYDLLSEAKQDQPTTVYMALPNGTKLKLRGGSVVVLVSKNTANPKDVFPLKCIRLNSPNMNIYGWTAVGTYLTNGHESEYDIVGVADESDTDNKSIMSIKSIALYLLSGDKLYTEKGSVLQFKDGYFWFNKVHLNFDKIRDVPLQKKKPVVFPFELNPVHGTHCKVWDNDPEQSTYVVITRILQLDNKFIYTDSSNTTWLNAVPI